MRERSALATPRPDRPATPLHSTQDSTVKSFTPIRDSQPGTHPSTAENPGEPNSRPVLVFRIPSCLAAEAATGNRLHSADHSSQPGILDHQYSDEHFLFVQIPCCRQSQPRQRCRWPFSLTISNPSNPVRQTRRKGESTLAEGLCYPRSNVRLYSLSPFSRLHPIRLPISSNSPKLLCQSRLPPTPPRPHCPTRSGSGSSMACGESLRWGSPATTSLAMDRWPGVRDWHFPPACSSSAIMPG